MGYCFAARGALSPAGTRATRSPFASGRRQGSEAKLIVRRTKREIVAAGESLKLAASYYAFIAVLAEKFPRDLPATKTIVVQGAVVAKLRELLQTQPEWFDERSQKFVQNASSALDADPISHLKSDFKKTLAGEKYSARAAEMLSSWLPSDKEWNLKLPRAEIRFE